MVKYTVLSTKHTGRLFIEAAKKNNINIIEQEFINTRPIITRDKERELGEIVTPQTEFVVFTSSNAVTALEHYLGRYDSSFAMNWKIFCLQGKTKETLLHSTLPKKDIIATANNASLLAQKIIEHGVKEIVFFCGNKRRDELPVTLQKAGICIHEVVLYKTVAVPQLTYCEPDGILFFSPSAVESFFSVNKLYPKTVCFAIGQTTADTIRHNTHNKIVVTDEPGRQQLLDTLNVYFQNINCQE
jgi:uroporphyrinogen-III synthase